MNMQVDIPTPPQPLLVSLKRARDSSPSPSPVDQDSNLARPMKRPSLGLRIGSKGRPTRTVSNGTTDSARRVEDWVSGLHLDSPHLSCCDSTDFSSHGGSAVPSEADLQEEPMTDEFESSIALFVTPPTISYSEVYPNGAVGPILDSHLFGHDKTSMGIGGSLAPPTLTLRTDHLTPSSNPQPPHIHILPATPSSRHGSALPSPMAISPSSSSAWSPSSPNTRRARLTMGPRHDCAKCRENVKGHWMHYE